MCEGILEVLRGVLEGLGEIAILLVVYDELIGLVATVVG